MLTPRLRICLIAGEVCALDADERLVCAAYTLVACI